MSVIFLFSLFLNLQFFLASTLRNVSHIYFSHSTQLKPSYALNIFSFVSSFLSCSKDKKVTCIIQNSEKVSVPKRLQNFNTLSQLFVRYRSVVRPCTEYASRLLDVSTALSTLPYSLSLKFLSSSVEHFIKLII